MEFNDEKFLSTVIGRLSTTVTVYESPTEREINCEKRVKDPGIITKEKLEFGDHIEKISINKSCHKWSNNENICYERKFMMKMFHV